MLTLYLVCLMFGGTLLALTFILGGDQDTDAGEIGDADIDAEIDDADVQAEIGSGDVDGDAPADVPADVDAGADTHVELNTDTHSVQHGPVSDGAIQQAEGQPVGDAFKFISLRSLIFFTAFFGLTGSVLTWMGISSALTLASSIGLGGFASVLTHRLMNYFKKTESGEAIDVYSLAGHTARVVLSPTKTMKGKVKVDIHDQTLTLLALLDEDSSQEMLPVNSWALIVRVEKHAVYVIEADYMDS